MNASHFPILFGKCSLASNRAREGRKPLNLPSRARKPLNLRASLLLCLTSTVSSRASLLICLTSRARERKLMNLPSREEATDSA